MYQCSESESRSGSVGSICLKCSYNSLFRAYRGLALTWLGPPKIILYYPHYRTLMRIRSFHFDADPTFCFDAESDLWCGIESTFHFGAESNPTFNFYADPAPPSK